MAIAAPVIGDIGSCVSALLAGIDSGFSKPGAEWTNAIAERRQKKTWRRWRPPSTRIRRP
ncbi:hypothetical protein ACFS07_13720 [Undibacterium arcticum]